MRKQPTFDALLAAGINLFDTAEIYTMGASERTIGHCIKGSDRSAPASPVVLTKFFPMPWRLGKPALLAALKRSLERLQLSRVDVYLLHFPIPPVALETWADALADAVQAGLTRAVGISNCNVMQTRMAHAVLAARGVPLACNEVELSLLKRAPERTGLLDTCKELGVTVIAYRPLAMGMLTGKYNPEHPPRRDARPDVRPPLSHGAAAPACSHEANRGEPRRKDSIPGGRQLDRLQGRSADPRGKTNSRRAKTRVPWGGSSASQKSWSWKRRQKGCNDSAISAPSRRARCSARAAAASVYSAGEISRMVGSDRVLIIEDDKDIADLVAMNLGDLGLQAERAVDGRSGLQKALEDEYALVILDLMLPKMDGLSVCTRIREKNPRTPILMLTAKSEELDRVLGLEIGADEYVTKPFSVRELMARVKALLRRVRTERDAAGGPGGEGKDRACGTSSWTSTKRKVILDEEYRGADGEGVRSPRPLCTQSRQDLQPH